MTVTEHKPSAALIAEKKGMAALGQRGLPVGPVLPITGGYTTADAEAQKAKNDTQAKTLSQTQSQ